MNTAKNINVDITERIEPDFIERFWEESWTYIKTVADIVRDPILILDKDLRVMAANESFYRTFQVEPKDSEGKIVYRAWRRPVEHPGSTQAP